MRIRDLLAANGYGDVAQWHSVPVLWDDMHIDVVASSPDVAAHVAAHHHVTAAPVVPRSTKLFAIADRRLLDAITSTLPGGGEVREAFKSSFYRSVVVDWCHVLVSADGHAEGHVLLSNEGKEWLVVAPTTEFLGAVLNRTIRELVRERQVGRGAVMFHAAAVSIADAGALVLAGDGGVGKTTLAAHLALASGSCVSTDRTMLVRRSGTWWAVGLPSTMRLGRQAAQDLVGHGAVVRLAPGVKLALSNFDAHRRVGCTFMASAPARAICLLERSMTARPSLEMWPPDAADRLSAVTLHPDDAYRSFWLADDAEMPPFDAGAALRTMARVLPIFVLRWMPGRDAAAHAYVLLADALRRTSLQAEHSGRL